MTRAFIGLGGNLGDVLGAFRTALDTLEERGHRVVRVSNAYRTLAMVPPGRSERGPDYWNAVCELETALEPRELLDLLHEIERAAGRERRAPWEDRPLDLDILVYGDRQVDEPGLTVPHPGIGERPFVLHPFAEVACDAVVPGVDMTVGALLEHHPDRYAGIEYVLRGWLDLGPRE
jgi:2-amino-4-hydroxy-6-hydroxymethyldihydropteridine diphosphokinase